MGRTIAMRTVPAGGGQGTLSWPLLDHLGSTVGMTDSNGVLATQLALSNSTHELVVTGVTLGLNDVVGDILAPLADPKDAEGSNIQKEGGLKSAVPMAARGR